MPLLEPVRLSREAATQEVAIVLGGDFAPADAALTRIGEHGWRWPYLATRELLAGAEVSFANLEAPVTESSDEFPLYKEYLYRVDPAATEAWRWLGLDLVSLANNHVVDYRDRGIVDTVRHLDGAALAHVGAGASESEARRPVIVEAGGVRVGFLAYLEDSFLNNLYFRTFAVGSRVGCARFVEEDVAEDVGRLRPLVDLLVVSVHWGENYAPVTAAQEEMAAFLAGLGVDVVAGHGPHDVQPVERKGGTIVFYSLGNYAWGAIGRDSLRVGFLARVIVARASRQIARVEIIPIATQNRLVDYQPRPLRPEEMGWLEPFLAASRARGANVELAGDRVLVR